MDEKTYYLGFSLFPGIGSKKFFTLLTAFHSAKKAWEADASSLIDVLGEALVKKFIDFRKIFSFEKALQDMSSKNVSFVIPDEKEYPQLLKHLSTYPFILYVKGNIDMLNSQQTIGIVGTRKISSYGQQVTESLTKDLVEAGFTVVSGLALGVDACAHMTTIKNSGKTIAVLGCGVDCCTPITNQKIYDEILATDGAIVSTFPVGMEATKGSFPARNAIIAGLSQAVLVTEGAADSGALITADYAKKFGRPVFAVPGPITSQLSKGANTLIRQGAIAVDNASDIFQVLDIKKRQGTHRKLPENLTNEEMEILDMIQLCPLHFDEIVRTIGKSPREIGSILSLLELKGLIQNTQGMISKQL